MIDVYYYSVTQDVILIYFVYMYSGHTVSCGDAAEGSRGVVSDVHIDRRVR